MNALLTSPCGDCASHVRVFSSHVRFQMESKISTHEQRRLALCHVSRPGNLSSFIWFMFVPAVPVYIKLRFSSRCLLSEGVPILPG